MTPAEDDAPIVVHCFGIARELFGSTRQMRVHTIAELCAQLQREAGKKAATVLNHCTFLVHGQRRSAEDTQPLQPGTTIDIMPPFAGG